MASLPFGLHEVDDARPIHPDWVVTRPILSGVCGSDAKLVLGDFHDGDIDNPMAAFSSLPHVPGHEVMAEVVAVVARFPAQFEKATQFGASVVFAHEPRLPWWRAWPTGPAACSMPPWTVCP